MSKAAAHNEPPVVGKAPPTIVVAAFKAPPPDLVPPNVPAGFGLTVPGQRLVPFKAPPPIPSRNPLCAQFPPWAPRELLRFTNCLSGEPVMYNDFQLEMSVDHTHSIQDVEEAVSQYCNSGHPVHITEPFDEISDKPILPLMGETKIVVVYFSTGVLEELD